MKRITVIPGDGIGPEITEHAVRVLKTLNLGLEFDFQDAGETSFNKTGEYLPKNLIDSFEKNKIALKGPITTPIGHGFRSINVELRKRFDLYANIRPVKHLGNIDSKFENVDLIIFRENTEDLYAGVEKQISSDEAHSIKIITRDKSERLVRKAFEYAERNNIEKVTVVTKANIMKLTDGLFLDVARDVKKDFDIDLEEVLIDNICMQLVMNPEKYQVIVTENLYGDILSDLCAGLIGGLGLCPGANIGEGYAMFEAVHGSAPDIAGKGIANPTALILSSAMMLEYINEDRYADIIRKSVAETYMDRNNFTKDLGGNLTGEEFTDILINKIKERL